jgi:hypothetical protein
LSSTCLTFSICCSNSARGFSKSKVIFIQTIYYL